MKAREIFISFDEAVGRATKNYEYDALGSDAHEILNQHKKSTQSIVGRTKCTRIATDTEKRKK
jgi:hypothetical protein